MNIDSYVQQKIAIIEKHLKKCIPLNKEKGYKELFEAASYSLHAPGKRFRPLLVLATTEMFHVNTLDALGPACAIECIHTYSMIHDDLPCMDDDDFRRGKLSLHKAFPEWLALLAGDYLLTKSFEILANSEGLNSDQKVELIDILTRRSGGQGMIIGQVVDLHFEGKTIDFDTLQFMHLNKTAALIIASLEFGCVIGKSSQKDRKTLELFGKTLGLAYQVLDDILDVTSTQKTLGKPIGSDVARQKATSVSLLGIERAQKLYETLSSQALKQLSQLSIPTFTLQELTKKLLKRKK